MRIPVWLLLGVAAFVIAFGGYRLYLATRPAAAAGGSDQPRSGFYRMSRRTHLLIGVIYILLGAGLIATSLGWTPLG